jgi:hypothetical protein
MLKISLSFPLSKVETDVSSLMRPLILHMMKCKLYPNSRDIPYWFKEIISYLGNIRSSVNNVKIKSGKVKPELLLKWMLPFAQDNSIFNNQEILEEEYKKSSIQISPPEIQEALKRSIPLLLSSERIPLVDIRRELLK